MYFRRYDLGGKDSTDATAFAYAEKKHHITNGDKLRAMSDEELAEFLTTEDMCELICAPAPPHCDGQCKQKMLDWLRQEAQP